MSLQARKPRIIAVTIFRWAEGDGFHYRVCNRNDLNDVIAFSKKPISNEALDEKLSEYRRTSKVSVLWKIGNPDLQAA